MLWTRVRVVGHDEHRGPERRLVPPPAPPPVVGPLAGLRPELAPSHDLGADALAPHAGQGAFEREGRIHLIDPMNGPTVEPAKEPPGTANRGVERHMIAGSVAVKGDAQVVDACAGHGGSLMIDSTT